MSDRPEIESHSMGPCVDGVYQISKGYDILVAAEKTVTKISYYGPLMLKI
jgi:hypothetical protein